MTPRGKRSPVLVLTGRRDRRRHVVRVHGQEVKLTLGEFRALCALVVARVTTDTGLAELERMTISRLREKLDEAFARRTLGRELIHTGSGPEFYLSIDPAEIAREHSCRELEGHGFISREVFDLLYRHVAEMQ